MKDINVLLHGKRLQFKNDEWVDIEPHIKGEKNDGNRFQVSYKCQLFNNSNEHIKDIGMIKIWSNKNKIKHNDAGLEEVINNDYNIECIEDFRQADGQENVNYYSFGTDTYYENLKALFTNPDDYKAMLDELNDISLLMNSEKDEKEKNEEEQIKSDIRKTLFFQKIIFKGALLNKCDVNEYVRKAYIKESVTYLYKEIGNFISTTWLDSNEGIYNLKMKPTDSSVEKLIRLFTDYSKNSILRGNYLDKGLFYACDMPEQIIVFGNDINIKDISAKVIEESHEREDKTKYFLHGIDYEFKRRNLLKQINPVELNYIDIKDEIENLKRDDYFILIDALRDQLDYCDFKAIINSLNPKGNTDYWKRVKSIDKEKLRRILKLIASISRNKILIIENSMDEVSLKIIDEISKNKHFIAIYMNEDASSNDLNEISDYIEKEEENEK